VDDPYADVEAFLEQDEIDDEKVVKFVLDLIVDAIPVELNGEPDAMALTSLAATNPDDEGNAWIIWPDGDRLAKLDYHPIYGFDTVKMARLLAAAPVFMGALAQRVQELNEEIMTYQVDNGYQNGYDHGHVAAATVLKGDLENAIETIEELSEDHGLNTIQQAYYDRLKQLVTAIDLDRAEESRNA